MFSYKSLLISSVVITFLIIPAMSLAQCNTRLSYSVERNKSSDDGQDTDFSISISMKLEEGGGNSVIELFDLFKGQTIESKEVSFTSHELKKVFINVKPSRYLIYVENAGCTKKSITTSIEGIEIK